MQNTTANQELIQRLADKAKAALGRAEEANTYKQEQKARASLDYWFDQADQKGVLHEVGKLVHG